MSGPFAEEGTTDQWVVVWFPPDKEFKTKIFDDENRAREYATVGYVAEWAPLLEHRIVTTISELVPL